MDNKLLERLFLVYECGTAFSRCSTLVEDNKKTPLGFSKGSLRPLNRGDRITEVAAK